MEQPALARRLGTADAVVIGLGSMIGAGVFSAFGPAARAVGAGLLIGLVLAASIAYCNATAASTCPTATGEWRRLAARPAPRSSDRRERSAAGFGGSPETSRRRIATARFLSHGASLTKPGGMGGVGDGSAGPPPPVLPLPPLPAAPPG
jgi:hypothetical protein